MKRAILLAAAVLLVAGCGSSPAGGTSGGRTIRLPPLTFTVHSQLWAADWRGLLPEGLSIVLVEGRNACADPEALVQERGASWLTIWTRDLEIGATCTVHDSHDDLDPEAPCHAWIAAWRVGDDGRAYRTDAVQGTLAIEEATDGRLAGRLRAHFLDVLSSGGGCEYGGTGEYGFGRCECEEPGGLRTCSNGTAEDLYCCDDGIGVTELDLAFEAESCAAVGNCAGGLCPPQLSGACAPADEPVDCAAACAGYEAVCAACSGCPADDRECLSYACHRTDPCPDACERHALDPVAAAAFRCFARAGTCEEWQACLASCGR